MQLDRLKRRKPVGWWFFLGFALLAAATAVPIAQTWNAEAMSVQQAHDLLASPGSSANQRHLAAAALGRTALAATRLLCSLSEGDELCNVEARQALKRLYQEIHR
jgi:uncharacterized membrane protein YjdF